MRKPIEIILVLITHRHRVEAFSQQFRGCVTNPIGPTRIEQLIANRFGQAKLMIELAQKNRTRMRSKTLIEFFHLDRTVKFRLEQVQFRFTHQVIPPCDADVILQTINTKLSGMIA